MQHIKHRILTKRGYILAKNKLSKNEIKTIKYELCVTPKAMTGFDNKENDKSDSFKLYKENDKQICVPRYYGIKKFGKPLEKIGLKTKKLNFNFKGDLREKQKPIMEKSITHLKEKGGGLLKLHCGCGKTVMAIYLACKFKLKTLIVVHKTFLQNQWIEQIKNFTDAKIGIIRQNKIDIEGKDIVVGMLQSISMKDYDLDLFKDFGMVIYDEAHHVASKVFSNALFKTGAKYTLGLSATPNRLDGLTKVMYWYIGDIMYKLERAGDRRVVVKSFNYFTKDKLFVEKKRYIAPLRDVKPNVPIMISNIQRIKQRNEFIINILDELKNHEERKILVLSGRIEHLETLKKMMDGKIKEQIKNGSMDKGECTTGLYIGKMKKYEQDDATKADIIFASYAMAEEGLDIPTLNTLFLVTPKKNIVQCVGRILRKQIQTGDLNPLVIDMIDQLSVFTNQGRVRNQYYSKKDYTIQYYNSIHSNVVNKRKYIETFHGKDYLDKLLKHQKIDNSKIDFKSALYINQDEIDKTCN